jgi:hypothetical protein
MLMNKIYGVSRKFSTNILNNLMINTEQFKSNLKYLDKIVITVHNPQTVVPNSLFNSHIYDVDIKMNKNSLYIYKNFKSNDYDKLMNEIKTFLNEEIKL